MQPTATALDQAANLIRESQNILISTHLLPDGDGLGAEVALYHYLKKSGKKGRILNPDPLPKRYQFLDPKKQLMTSSPEDISKKNKSEPYDLWIILDTHDPRRLGRLWTRISLKAHKILFLDHHPVAKGKFAVSYPPNTAVISLTQASSIGEILYRLFEEIDGAPIDRKVALGLYVSVMTDTNSFRSSKTTPDAHHIAAEMIGYGINPETIYQAIYSSKTIRHLKLLGIMLQNAQISPSGKIAWIEMTRELRAHHQATADETLSFLNLLLLIRDAEVICFFREEDNGETRVSIQSKGRIRVSQIAIALGGGGHRYAAGLALPYPLQATRALIISRLETLIQTQGQRKK